MGLFDFFKKKRNSDNTQDANNIEVFAPLKPATEFSAAEKAVSDDSSEGRPIIHQQFSDEDIAYITNEYINRNGLRGLSNKELEIAKPFFVTLFTYFHNNAVQNDHSNTCMRNGCNLTKNAPVFMTASKVLCKNCALQYVIGNCSNWIYYLDNFAPLAGSIPSYIQREGSKIKEEILALRSSTTDDLSDEELLYYILDDNNDSNSRSDAVLKIKNIETVVRLVEKTHSYSVLLNALEFDLPRDTVVKIIEMQTMNNEWAGKVRRKATLKLSQEDLEAVLEGKIPGATFHAISKIENKEFLQKYIETAKYEDDRAQAKKRLLELTRESD